MSSGLSSDIIEPELLDHRSMPSGEMVCDEKECRKGALTILSPAVTPSALLLNLPLLTFVALL